MSVRPQLHCGQGAVAAPGALQGDQLRVSQVHIVGCCAYLCAPADPGACCCCRRACCLLGACSQNRCRVTGPLHLSCLQVQPVTGAAAPPPKVHQPQLPGVRARQAVCVQAAAAGLPPQDRWAVRSCAWCPFQLVLVPAGPLCLLCITAFWCRKLQHALHCSTHFSPPPALISTFTALSPALQPT